MKAKQVNHSTKLNNSATSHSFNGCVDNKHCALVREPLEIGRYPLVANSVEQPLNGHRGEDAVQAGRSKGLRRRNDSLEVGERHGSPEVDAQRPAPSRHTPHPALGLAARVLLARGRHTLWRRTSSIRETIDDGAGDESPAAVDEHAHVGRGQAGVPPDALPGLDEDEPVAPQQSGALQPQPST